jgi:hypothetical protein
VDSGVEKEVTHFRHQRTVQGTGESGFQKTQRVHTTKVRVQLKSEKRIRVQLRPKLVVLEGNFAEGSQ